MSLLPAAMVTHPRAEAKAAAVVLRDVNTVPIDPDIFGSKCGATMGWSETVDILGDPQIGALGANGGPTETCAILTQASNAVNKSIQASPPMSLTDQRGPGFSAPIGPAYDIGAFEWRPVASDDD